jgi:hypothetical protein
MKGEHYTKESVVLEQQSTAGDAFRWKSYRQYLPEDSVAYPESLFTTKGSQSVKEIWRRYTRVLCDSSVARMRRDKNPTREYWYCKYTDITFFDHMQRRAITKTIQEYLDAKESSRAPGQARALLPPPMYTQFSMTGTLQRGMPCIAGRSAPEVQYATRLITSLRAASIARCFPSLTPSSLRCTWMQRHSGVL